MRELIIDSFAGGGGASLGIKLALGREADVAINHDAAAIAMHAANHPGTRHYTEDVWKLTPRKVTGGRPVGLLWSSPDCCHFSRAKGGKPVKKSIRSLAWVVVRWADQVKPRLIILENVREFADWGPLVPAWRCKACGWRGTEGQAVLVRRRRRCPECESLRLEETPDQLPDPARKGLTFRRFLGRLRGLGYDVAYKNLNAADFGAPTHRRRLFLVARCDGAPIIWPEPTHADPKKLDSFPLFGRPEPWRTAAEIIDWTLPCPSIFDRKRPLAEATLRRIAMGIKRYVLDNPRPFIVTYYGVNKPSNEFRGSDLQEPLRTATAENRFGLVSPLLVRCNHGGEHFRGQQCQHPMCTVTAAHDAHGLVAPVLARLSQSGGNGKYANAPEEPLTTIVSKPVGVDRPSTTVLGLDKPLGTAVDGQKHALVAAYLAKHFGGVVGVPADTPLPTTTARGTQNQIVAANFVHMNHGAKQWNAIDEPLRTVTGGNHAALVCSFMTKYFGRGIGQAVDEPLHAALSRDHFGLVTVSIEGEPYVIADIGMRMLSPRELARAQGFPDSYVLTGTKSAQVAKIGNSVCPVMARVLVEANYAAAALSV